MAEIDIFNPDTINPPRGAYSHVAEAAAGAKLVAIAGQVAIDRDGEIVGKDDFDRQCQQVYENIGAALKAAGGDWENVLQFMSFLVRRQDIPKFAAFRQREYAKFYPTGKYPPNTLLLVSGLVTEALLLEVQAIAAI
jgi:enamine deaminase RidA (YjgF/YER057c/UK114 family)